MLKPGALWVNIGPLLYHYSEDLHEMSIDLSWEQVREVILKIGFSFEVPNFPNFANI